MEKQMCQRHNINMLNFFSFNQGNICTRIRDTSHLTPIVNMFTLEQIKSQEDGPNKLQSSYK